MPAYCTRDVCFCCSNLVDSAGQNRALSGVTPTRILSLGTPQHRELNLNNLDGTLPAQLGALTNLQIM